MTRELALVLITVGTVLVVIGLSVLLAGRFPGLPLGKLPGDLQWQRRGVAVHVPIATCLLLSVALSLLLRLLLRR